MVERRGPVGERLVGHAEEARLRPLHDRLAVLLEQAVAVVRIGAAGPDAEVRVRRHERDARLPGHRRAVPHPRPEQDPRAGSRRDVERVVDRQAARLAPVEARPPEPRVVLVPVPERLEAADRPPPEHAAADADPAHVDDVPAEDVLAGEVEHAEGKVVVVVRVGGDAPGGVGLPRLGAVAEVDDGVPDLPENDLGQGVLRDGVDVRKEPVEAPGLREFLRGRHFTGPVPDPCRLPATPRRPGRARRARRCRRVRCAFGRTAAAAACAAACCRTGAARS